MDQAPRIAVIGSGISGLAAAYELAPTHSVTLFEASPRLGGHARTVWAGQRNDIPVDTGFIVFNEPNYPNLTRMFRELSVPVKTSDMSFAVTAGDGAVEYALKDLSSIFAQRRNLTRPEFWRMLSDITQFMRRADSVPNQAEMTIGQLLLRMNLGDWFRRYYLLPMAGAIWSSTPEQIEAFPAQTLLQFFRNHALLNWKSHEWLTVDGGSIEYVSRIAMAIEGRGGTIRPGTPVAGIRRDGQGVQIRARGGEWEEFDEVILACHSDQALALLEAPTPDERAILGALRYQSNYAVLHRDERMMPKRRKCWASWVFLSRDDRAAPRIGMTYWMNSLQGIDPSDPLFVTLNPRGGIRHELIYDETEFRHPVFDRAAIRAQSGLQQIQGRNNTWYCGAYTRWGFHEDGYASAMNVARHLTARAEAA